MRAAFGMAMGRFETKLVVQEAASLGQEWNPIHIDYQSIILNGQSKGEWKQKNQTGMREYQLGRGSLGLKEFSK